jgi:hypothetical protein
MDPAEVLNYLKAAAMMLDLPLDADRAARVAAHMTRTAALAGLLDAVAIAVDDEPAELFRPAPFAPLEPGA